MRAIACALVLAAVSARAAEPAKQHAESAATPEAAFLDVAKVLQSPRCMNCHPNGNAPLQGDDSRVHAMGITRDIEPLGLTCQTCHRETHVAHELPGLPPAVKNWSLPPKLTPMIFQGRTPAALCAQLKDPAQNGNHDLAHLLTHVTNDPIVRWGFAPSGQRTPVPLPHDAFVARFKQWVDAGGPCPN